MNEQPCVQPIMMYQSRQVHFDRNITIIPDPHGVRVAADARRSIHSVKFSNLHSFLSLRPTHSTSMRGAIQYFKPRLSQKRHRPKFPNDPWLLDIPLPAPDASDKELSPAEMREEATPASCRS
jgi:hypothetical protein